MVPIDTPRKRIAILLIVILAISLNAGFADAATKTAKTSTTRVKGEKIIANKISVVGNNTITTYKVKDGDTLSGIASKFDISTNTIRWSNDISSKDIIKPGQTLIILPTTGVIYTVKKGDTLSGIAVKFSADQKDILNANDLADADKLKVGMTLAIPNAEPLDTESTDAVPDTTTPPSSIAPIAVPESQTATVQTVVVPQPPVTQSPETQSEAGATVVVTNPVTEKKYAIVVTPSNAVTSYPIPVDDIRGYYSQPISGRLSQGIHDVNAVDIAAPTGTTVHAAANGTVIVAMDNGAYNGGYGNYMVISHPNGTQTLYAHLSKITVGLGQEVAQGEPIALSGATGKVTGAHLHFEVRGGVNPWGADKIGTTYSI